MPQPTTADLLVLDTCLASLLIVLLVAAMPIVIRVAAHRPAPIGRLRVVPRALDLRPSTPFAYLPAYLRGAPGCEAGSFRDRNPLHPG